MKMTSPRRPGLLLLIESEPAYDLRDPNPSKSYGIHGVNLRFLVVGPLGVVQFLLHTNWQLPHVERELDSRPVDSRFPHLSCRPVPADLGYHSPKPMYEGQTPRDNCTYLGGRPCYYDGSGLNARKPYEILVAEGLDPMWEFLEDDYKRTFEESQ